MERFLDIIWEYIYAAILFLAGNLDNLLSPIHNLAGPATVIVLLAFITVLTTKFLGKKCRTKRHIKLEKEFNHWLGVREEAMRSEDREKGLRMARNIDQAKLNRTYYDYFFEGLLLSLATMYLPILMVISYVNAFYRPERLMELTGKEYIVHFGLSNGDPLLIGSIFFYFVSLVSFYLCWSVLKKVIERGRQKRIINEVTNQQIITAG
ncbi:MAG: TMCO1/EMC3 family protein [Desulfocapsa sp.]|nr:TMCO1/EMC3 family protein [Desulfocapsa sp.]